MRNEDFIKWDTVACLPNRDLSCHPGVDGTEVRVSSSRYESVGKRLTRLQYRRLIEPIVGASHNVRHIVVVGPGHRCTDWYGDGLGRKIEVIDNNLRLFGSWGRQLSRPRIPALRVTEKR